VYAHSIANGWAYKTVTVTAPNQPASQPARGQGNNNGPYNGGGYGYGGYGPQGPTTPYGGSFLNTPGSGYGGYGGGYGSSYGGYGGGCTGGYGYYDYYSTGCNIPPPPPISPYGGFGGYGGGGIPYQQTVTVVSPPGGTVVLSWIGTPAAQSYRIYQASATSPTSFSVVQTVQQSVSIIATNATVTGLPPGQTFFFQVRAVDPSGLETVVPAFTNGGGAPFPYPGGYPGPGLGGLTPPTGVIATGVTGTTVSLTWQPVPSAISYRVLQSIGTNGAFVPANVQNVTVNSAIVGGLSLSTQYSFQVLAVDAFGQQSLPSVPVTATTTAGP
jgi:hypothetical protein